MRAATKADLDAITWIVVGGFPDDPGCNYKFPYRTEYPDDFRKWTRLEYEGYLNQPDKYASLVTTAPVLAEGRVIQKPIAIGIWDVSACKDRGIDKRRDANSEHMKAYAAASSHGFEKYFAKYGNKQLNLWMLITHPDFRRRGAATMLGYDLVGSVTARVLREDEHVDIDIMEKIIRENDDSALGGSSHLKQSKG
ncbi:hypothetical protein M426DRAFT_315877 [Hypoxylon sp. CI-4A]|nr:hypothetical protein M426DRAFT_315877 [Hypoxylon sp. CI-4A]